MVRGGRGRTGYPGREPVFTPPLVVRSRVMQDTARLARMFARLHDEKSNRKLRTQLAAQTDALHGIIQRLERRAGAD